MDKKLNSRQLGQVFTTNDTWQRMLIAILSNGIHTSPRGKNTVELLGYQTIFDMNWPVITIPSRKLGYKFMLAEAYWILSGRNDVAFMSQYSKHISQFSDDGETFYGAYGPQILPQLDYIVDALYSDINSRRAVLTIWIRNPNSESKDIPCTVSLQWMIREHKLHCFVNMRSSDAWVGVPYDIFNFSMISAYVLLLLRRPWNHFRTISLGNLYWRAASQHLYLDNMGFDVRDYEAAIQGSPLGSFELWGTPKGSVNALFTPVGALDGQNYLLEVLNVILTGQTIEGANSFWTLVAELANAPR